MLAFNVLYIAVNVKIGALNHTSSLNIFRGHTKINVEKQYLLLW